MVKKLGLAALALTTVAGFALWNSGRDAGQTLLPPMAAGAQEAATSEAQPAVADMVMGAEDAPVTIVEYASFTCPHCATFENEVLAPLKRDYIDTGKVRFVFREVYFDRYGLWAAMIARCGGEMRYFGIADMIFDQQQEWVADDPQQVAANLRRIGKTAGLDDAALDACMNDQAKAEAMVAAFQKNSQADDITATPSLIVNGTKHSNMGYEELRKIIDAELAKG
ncbi:thioredoxin domain-containing protein [Cereibacter sphaeroides]|uniref:DsbA family protein n=1 Tax=Rhodobacterales TaxID=204455 RepID=UPI0018E08F84|nr:MULTISPECIES: DsbA family protein [Paracoccaceae]MCE6960099.1 thioredoxin domain-containing protein [Cereibacter sphaeroides]MCE6968642.1 thioredoxin domain-containing protein [Cereibacter sphaeroides]MCE6973183.1 thioredoxin domain-containing protein [Cereibacter sphaeroides]